MRLDPDYLLGRRFEWVNRGLPDITFVAFDVENSRVRVHALDGGKWWLPFNDVQAAILVGLIQESELGPFVNERNKK
jgi:hypothetical protein